jgi:hypothetical protein
MTGTANAQERTPGRVVGIALDPRAGVSTSRARPQGVEGARGRDHAGGWQTVRQDDARAQAGQEEAMT